jgi:hypothetical protein
MSVRSWLATVGVPANMGNLLGKRLGLAQRAKEVLKSAGGENVSSTGESSVDVKKTDRDLAGTTAR